MRLVILAWDTCSWYQSSHMYYSTTLMIYRHRVNTVLIRTTVWPYSLQRVFGRKSKQGFVEQTTSSKMPDEMSWDITTLAELTYSFRPGQRGRHFADDIFKYIFVNENRLLIWISPQFVPINNNSVLVRGIAWRPTGDTSSQKPIMIQLTDVLWRH